jgi:hypothetical protein
MTRDVTGPPAEFVAFVGRRAPGLRAAAHALSGNDRLAESLVDDLLGAIALRWRWLGFTERRMGRVGAADAYLDRIFRREVATWGRDAGSAHPRLRVGEPLPEQKAEVLAAYTWDLSRRLRRRRLMVAGGVALVLVVGVAMVPRNGPPRDDAAPPPPTGPPPRVDVLPSFAEQAILIQRESPLPSEIELDPATVKDSISTRPVSRALAIFKPIGVPPLVLGDDGALRRIDHEMIPDVWVSATRTAPPLTSASLAPDGTRAAFLGNGAVQVVDLRTAAVRRYDALPTNTAVVWLTPQTLLVAGPAGQIVLDLPTGRSAPTTIHAQHALTGQGGAQAPAPPPGTVPAGVIASAASAAPSASPVPLTTGPTGTALPVELAERVVELLPIGEPATAPARLRRYASAADVATPMDTAITGDRISWLGPWREPGFLVAGLSGSGPGRPPGGSRPSPGRAARDCEAVEMVLPPRYGRAEFATVVVNPTTGQVQRALVATRAATTLTGALLLGWLDRDTALIRTGDASTQTQHLLAWHVTDGDLRLVSVLDRDTTVSVADLTMRAGR